MDTGDKPTIGGNGQPFPNLVSPPSAAAVPSQGTPAEPSTPEASAGAPKRKRQGNIRAVGLRREQLAFIEALETGLTKTGACKAAKIHRRTLYFWLLETDKDGNPTPNAAAFRAEHDRAYAAGTEALIDEARRRAYEGWDEPKFDKHGEECGVVRKFDSTLLMFLIKQRDPSYRERYEVTGANGLPLHPAKVTLDVRHNYAEALKSLTDEELESHNAIAAKLLARSGRTASPGTN